MMTPWGEVRGSWRELFERARCAGAGRTTRVRQHLGGLVLARQVRNQDGLGGARELRMHVRRHRAAEFRHGELLEGREPKVERDGEAVGLVRVDVVPARGACERCMREVHARGACERCVREVRARGACERCMREVHARGACERCMREVYARGACERCGRRLRV